MGAAPVCSFGSRASLGEPQPFRTEAKSDLVAQWCPFPFFWGFKAPLESNKSKKRVPWATKKSGHRVLPCGYHHRDCPKYLRLIRTGCVSNTCQNSQPGATLTGNLAEGQTCSFANRTSQHDSSPGLECSAKPEQCWTCDRLEPARRLVCQSSDCLSHIAWPFFLRCP